MLAIRLSPEIEKRLDALAKRTGRTKTWYAREAILRQLEDLEDIYLAEKISLDIREGRSKTYTLEEVERSLGLDDHLLGGRKKGPRQARRANSPTANNVPSRARRQTRKSA